MSQATTYKRPKSTYPAWAPRFWHGMRFGDWWSLLQKNRFRVHPVRLGLAATITSATAFNTAASFLEHAVKGRKLDQTELLADPIFIVGHWRSGTTYVHELLSCDDRFATPTTYQCFAANHFLITEQWIPRLLWFIMPSKRPMDNVKVGWNAPQEDEFALCAMGIRSPYFRIAFPEFGDTYQEWLDFDGLSDSEVDEWKRGLDLFLRRVTLSTGKRLILKSPTHTARVGLLRQIYPNAKFVHIVRNPHSVYPSTLKLWSELDEAQGLQLRKHEIESLIIDTFQRMYAAFERDRREISDHDIVDLRYEDITNDPVGQIEHAY
ncbi:MAG: sulfotransferase, partial [Planctomycetales bacterium]|nr:sulfotransferase [Planctomycetales bacterium]